jgi:hypothetical protein
MIIPSIDQFTEQSYRNSRAIALGLPLITLGLVSSSTAKIEMDLDHGLDLGTNKTFENAAAGAVFQHIAGLWLSWL